MSDIIADELIKFAFNLDSSISFGGGGGGSSGSSGNEDNEGGSVSAPDFPEYLLAQSHFSEIVARSKQAPAVVAWVTTLWRL